MSARPSIYVTRKLPEAVIARLSGSYQGRLNQEDIPRSPDEIVAGAKGADAILVTPVDKINAELIDRLPDSVRMIATFSVGHEHIDLKAAKAKGLPVSNTPDVLTDATADITLLLMLGAARRAYEGERAVREGTWKSWSTVYMLGVHMTGKRLGIFGMGRIGQAVAKRARAFDMVIHYSNRNRLPPELEAGAVFHANADDMLSHFDILSINAPGRADT